MTQLQIINQQFGFSEKFQNYGVRIQGSWQNPFFCAKDILLILGYKKCSKMNAWNQISYNPNYVKNLDLITRQSSGEHLNQPFLSKRGLYEVISKSDMPKAIELRDWAFEIIDKYCTQQVLIISNEYNLQNSQLQIFKQKLSITNDQLNELKEETKEQKEIIQQQNYQKQILENQLEESKQNSQIKQCQLKYTGNFDYYKIKGEFLYVWTTLSYAKQNIFKIGQTGKNVKERIGNAQSSHYENIIILIVIECGDSQLLEKQLHTALSFSRRNGEFFKLKFSFLRSILNIIQETNDDFVCQFDESLDIYNEQIETGEIDNEEDEIILEVLQQRNYLEEFFTWAIKNRYYKMLRQWKNECKILIQIENFEKLIKQEFKDSKGKPLSFNNIEVERFTNPIVFQITKKNN